MGALTFLRITRRIPGLNKNPELPHLETLIEEDALKIKDGYRHGSWISALSGVVLAFGCFMPLALTVHPLFWIGTAGALVVGGGLALLLHFLDKGISSTQLLLRQRLYRLSMRLNALRNVLGLLPVLSPQVAVVLEEAATIYLRARPAPDRNVRASTSTLWDEAHSKAQRAMDDAMAQMLALTEVETPQAQEVELGRGWAPALLEEMRATAKALESHKQMIQSANLVDSQLAPLAGLRDARAELERLETAVSELEQETRS